MPCWPSAASAEPRITLRPGFALASVAQHGGDVRAKSATGAEATGAALVGADGLWSSTRRAIHPEHVPQFVGATATRTVIPVASAGRLASPVVGLWLGPGVNVAHYPVRGGSEIAVVVIATEAWQGKEWDVEADGAALLARLAGFHASLADPLAMAPAWRKWALYRLPTLPHWSAGRVTLIGDAAHPMLPHLAQGGVLALEDAVVLADCAGRPSRQRDPGVRSLRGKAPPPRRARAGHEPAQRPHLSPEPPAVVGPRRGAARPAGRLADGRLRLALRLAGGGGRLTRAAAHCFRSAGGHRRQSQAAATQTKKGGSSS